MIEDSKEKELDSIKSTTFPSNWESFLKHCAWKLFSWGPVGVGAVVAIDAIQDSNLFKALLSLVIALIWKLITAFLSALEAKIEPQMTFLANWIIEIFKENLEGIRFRKLYHIKLRKVYQNVNTKGLLSSKNLPLKIDQVFVPLKLKLDRTYDDKEEYEIWDFLAGLNTGHPCRLVLLGNAGSGKTTLLKYLTYEYATQASRDLDQRVPDLVPVLLRLREAFPIIQQNSFSENFTLADLINEQIKQLLREQIRQPPLNWFSRVLRNGKCLVMLDGLDEIVDKENRQKVSCWIDLQMKRYDTPFILTSRPYAYQDYEAINPDQSLTVLKVKEFGDRQVRDFIDNWYFQAELIGDTDKDYLDSKAKAKEKAKRLLEIIKHSLPLREMAYNPLLLTIITTVHFSEVDALLEKNRAQLYQNICDVMLKRRSAKGIQEKLSGMQKRSIIQAIAIYIMEKAIIEKAARNNFKLSDVRSLVQERLSCLQADEIDPDRALQEIMDTSGMFEATDDSDIYEFTNEIFQEYLTSVEVKESRSESYLVDKLNQLGIPIEQGGMPEEWADKWAETIRLYAAQTDATKIISKAQEINSIRTLSLAYDCLDEAYIVDPVIKDEMGKNLQKSLQSSDRRIALLAAEIQLNRRIKNALRLEKISENKEIDRSYITIAEYQLFINASKEHRKWYQPDHWKTHEFPVGSATEPIVGVRPSDAEAFCNWLTKKYPIPTGYRYRLPSASEAEKYPSDNKQVGTWCKNSQETVLVGLDLAQHQSWQKDFVDILNASLDEDINRAINLDRAFHPVSLAHVYGPGRSSELFNAVRHFKNFVYCCILHPAVDTSLILERIIELARQLPTAREFISKHRPSHPSPKLRYKIDLAHDLDIDLILDFGIRLTQYQSIADNLGQLLHISPKRTERLIKTFGYLRSHDEVQALQSEFPEDDSLLILNIIHAEEPTFCADDMAIDRDLVKATCLALKLFQAFCCLHERDQDQAHLMRSYLLLNATLWSFLSNIYRETLNNPKLSIANMRNKQTQALIEYCSHQRDEAFELYSLLVLIDQRREGNMLAWEGIRIVRERTAR